MCRGPRSSTARARVCAKTVQAYPGRAVAPAGRGLWVREEWPGGRAGDRAAPRGAPAAGSRRAWDGRRGSAGARGAAGPLGGATARRRGACVGARRARDGARGGPAGAAPGSATPSRVVWAARFCPISGRLSGRVGGWQGVSRAAVGLGCAARAGWPVEGRPEDTGEPVARPQVRQPRPRAETGDRHATSITRRRQAREEGLGGCRAVRRRPHRPSRVQEAHSPRPGLESDPPVGLLRWGVASPAVASAACACEPRTSRPRW